MEDLRRLEIEIRSAAPAYARIAYPEPAGPREAQDILRDGEVLVEYLLGDEGSWLWAVTRSGIEWRSLPPRSRVEPLVRRFLESIRPGALGPGGEEGASLARILLPDDVMRARARLIVVPDGILHHLPFEALPVVEPGSGTLRLAERLEVAYAPSASTLGMLRRLPAARPGGARILAVGEPAPLPGEEVSGLPPLPHARAEAERAAARFPPARRRLLVGAQATEAALKAAARRPADILHLAVHGLIDEEAPARSALLLAPGGGDDGVLQMNEVFALRLPVRLVVLSACRSGLGTAIRGEGMIGLTQAFLHAGARALVVSLWNVGDRPAADFMDRFYADLERGAPPAAALRGAKLAALRSAAPSDRHPGHWAAFVLIGDPEGGVNRGRPGAT
jgi:hypothetical protein